MGYSPYISILYWWSPDFWTIQQYDFHLSLVSQPLAASEPIQLPLLWSFVPCLAGDISSLPAVLAGNMDIIRSPIGSMCGIFTYIYHKDQPNVGTYVIHGSYGSSNHEIYPREVYGVWEKFAANLPFQINTHLSVGRSSILQEIIESYPPKAYIPRNQNLKEDIWWFQPIWKIWVNWDHVTIKQYLKPPPSYPTTPTTYPLFFSNTT